MVAGLDDYRVRNALPPEVGGYPFVAAFGSSVSPGFHLFRVTILSVIQRLLLPDVVCQVDGTDRGSALLHVVLRASYPPATKSACCGRYISNG